MQGCWFIWFFSKKPKTNGFFEKNQKNRVFIRFFWFKLVLIGFYKGFFGFNSAKPLYSMYPMIYNQFELIFPAGKQIKFSFYFSKIFGKIIETQ